MVEAALGIKEGVSPNQNPDTESIEQITSTRAKRIKDCLRTLRTTFGDGTQQINVETARKAIEKMDAFASSYSDALIETLIKEVNGMDSM